MTWEQLVEMAKTLIAFNELDAENKKRVALIVDGLKVLATREKEQKPPNRDGMCPIVRDLI